MAPHLLDHRRYNPILAVVVMLALTDALGVTGLLLAVPLAAVIQITVSEFLSPSTVALPAGPSRVLQTEHYKTQVVAIQTAIAAANGRLSPIQASLVERLSRLTEEAEGIVEWSPSPEHQSSDSVPTY